MSSDVASGIYNAANLDPSATVQQQQLPTRPGAAINSAMGDIIDGLMKHKKQMQQNQQAQQPQAIPLQAAQQAPPMQGPMGGSMPMSPMGGAGSGGAMNALFSTPPATGYGYQ